MRHRSGQSTHWWIFLSPVSLSPASSMDILQHNVLTNTNGVTVLGKHLLHTEVADDDVALFLDQTILV